VCAVHLLILFASTVQMSH